MPALHFYDFDGTLFRSPHKPAIWKGDWWSSVESLMPPCVPDKPGSDWWVGSTVSAAKRSISNPDVWAVMMTGRSEQTGLRYRIPELLKQKGLNFDEVHLSPVGDSEAEKIKRFRTILRLNPEIDAVSFWDDRPSHLRHFAKVAEKLGIDPSRIETNLVRAKSKDAECGEEAVLTDPQKIAKAHYTAVWLDAASKAKLAKAYGFSHDKICSDHVTLNMGPPSDPSIIGEKVKMKVVGYTEDDQSQVVVVNGVQRLMGDSRTPHITMSRQRDCSSKRSNDLLREGYESVNGPTLTGIVDTYPHSLSPMERKASVSRVASLYAAAKSK